MTDVNYDAIRLAFDAAQMLGLIGVGVYTWWVNRQRATKDAITRVDEQRKTDVNRLEERMREHSDRLLKAEQQIKHLPDGEKIGQVHYRIDQVGQGLRGMEGQMSQMNNTLRLIQEHLLGMSS